MSYAGTSAVVGAPQLAPTKQIDAHAQKLHELASTLGHANERLAAIIDRLCGPSPEAAGKGDPQPEPRGVLMIAQFGAERIARQASDLHARIDRIESMV